MNLNKIDRDVLLKPLQAVSGIIERRHTLPILSNVLLYRSGDRLDFIATDIEIEIDATTNVGAQAEANAITIGARKFLDILRALPEESQVTLLLLEKRLQIKAGKSRFNLQTLPPEDFPRLAPSEELATEFTVPQSVLKQLLHLVQYAMAQQDIRYYLNGLLMIAEQGEIKVVATDGHRLAYAARALPEANLARQEVILPRKTVLELARLLTDSDEAVSVSLSPSQARFSFSNVKLVSKLVDGKFPDYTRVVPEKQPRHLHLNRTDLLDSLQRVAILTSDKFRGVRWLLSTGTLKISCSNTEQEEAQEEMDVEYAGDTLDIGFNVGYLLDVLTNLEATELDFSLGDANSSVLITIPGRDDFKYVVMPLRI